MTLAIRIRWTKHGAEIVIDYDLDTALLSTHRPILLVVHKPGTVKSCVAAHFVESAAAQVTYGISPDEIPEDTKYEVSFIDYDMEVISLAPKGKFVSPRLPLAAA